MLLQHIPYKEITAQKTNPFKSPGQSGISNLILKRHSLLSLTKSRHYPKKLAEIHQIVHPKPGRATYELANSYHSIARGPLSEYKIITFSPTTNSEADPAAQPLTRFHTERHTKRPGGKV